ncbi:helix-turn-helix domain-containing protein [Hymenobacter sp. HSC-4F20]|uniref:helix-turn-helix domain-containing protein n=1 Tax=Hymenobacter sp. HSC-4F20 TaxID=2864135 RepID=UPI001C72CCEF|nr:helix-turn-helix domain-containing protein [Hymenobacter sp. HSC-4F20]MBX0293130.1 helix-turn-helix domain-containing protein [Hymenobacter sp. HSC-4F20]
MSQNNTLLMEEVLKSFVEKVNGPLTTSMEQITDSWLRQYFAQRPQPDPQYTAQEVAELLALEVSTVRSYFKKPEGHVRRLPFIQCTDTARGYRVRLSDIRAWQDRNLIDALKRAEQQAFEEKAAAIGAKRRARRGRTPNSI